MYFISPAVVNVPVKLGLASGAFPFIVVVKEVAIKPYNTSPVTVASPFTRNEDPVIPPFAVILPAVNTILLLTSAKVPIVVLMLFHAACVAVLIGSPDGDVLATFPNPRDVGVIAETEAAVASVESVLIKDVLLPPYKKSLLLTLP